MPSFPAQAHSKAAPFLLIFIFASPSLKNGTASFFNLNFFMGAFLKWQNVVSDNERFFQFANVF